MKLLSVPSWFLWFLVIALAFAVGALLRTQHTTPDSPKGFVLPEGDLDRGKQAFVSFSCVDCHLVTDEVFNIEPKLQQPIQLGGPRYEVMTYGRLVTSIIHPSESIKENAAAFQVADGQSLMPNYAGAMTVQELSDLVTYLIDHYEVWRPDYQDQFYYGYPPYTNLPMP
ncbi:MAG: c-type cytochrome [Coraliomargarita sp.]